MEVTSAVERRGTEPQPSNGHLPRSWPCPQEDRTPSLMGPQPLRAWGMQYQGPSVLESKVRALKEKMTAGKQGASPSLTAHERSAPKKPKCRRVKVGGARTPSEGSPLPDAAVVLHAQNLTDRPRNSSVSEEEAARNGGPGPPRPPAPGLKCWKEKSPWPPEAVWTLPDHERDMLPGPGSLQDSPIHRATPGWPRGPGPCNNVTHAPKPRKGRSYLLWDGLYTGGDLDSLSLTSKEDFVPRPALLGGLWRAADPGALDTGGSVLPLSDRVERNRLLLQEMLLVAGKGPPKVGIPAWTPSWDSTVPERPAGDVDWDSGISLQDSDQNRTFGPKPEPVLRSPRHEEGKHVLQRARVKARTRPLRASHDIVPAVAQGSRDGRRSPALDRRTPLGCRDQLQTGSTSDSSSGESGGGPWPQRGPSPSHVRFEDESAREAESRYLERLQQRQGLSPAPPAGGQGPLRSKPELASYIAGGPPRAEVGDGAPHGLVEPLGQGPLPAPPPTRGSQRTCGGRGSCVEDRRPGLGTAAAHPRALQERKAASGLQALSAEPPSSRGPSAPLRLLPAKPGPRTTRAPETHPEEADSALDSTDTSDSGRTDSEEAGPSPRGGARPRAGRTRLGKAASESARGPGCQAGVDLQEVPDEARDGRGHTPEGAAVPGEEAPSTPPVRGAKTASPGSQRHPGPGPGNHGAHPEDSWALVRKACATASLMTLPSPGPHRQPQLVGSRESREAVPLPQNQEERSAPPQAWQPPASLSPKGWVPTPPAPRKTTSPGSHRKAVLAGPRRPGDQGEPADSPLPPSRSEVPTVSELSPPQAEPCSPDVSRPLLTLSTTNCNNSEPRGPQEPWGGAAHEGRVLKGARSREPEAPLENCGDGVGTISSVGITLSLASEEPESSQEPEGGLRRTELSSEVPVSSRALPGVSARPGPPSAAPSDRNKKSSSSLASTLGLKKLFLALGQGARPRLGKSRSCSVEQLQPPAPGLASHTSTPKVKRAPSLQYLHLVSSPHQHRKAASFQNLHSLLSGKVDRSSLYLVGEPGDHSADGRLAKIPPRRALSVEDVGAPSLARTVGRVVEVFPDGTSQLQLQRSPEGTFGFCVASGNGRRDSGFYVQEMADTSTAKLYSGLLGVGDEILEVNGAKVAGLGLAHVKELLAHAESLSLRVLRQRPGPR